MRGRPAPFAKKLDPVAQGDLVALSIGVAVSKSKFVEHLEASGPEALKGILPATLHSARHIVVGTVKLRSGRGCTFPFLSLGIIRARGSAGRGTFDSKLGDDQVRVERRGSRRNRLGT